MVSFVFQNAIAYQCLLVEIWKWQCHWPRDRGNKPIPEGIRSPIRSSPVLKPCTSRILEEPFGYSSIDCRGCPPPPPSPQRDDTDSKTGHTCQQPRNPILRTCLIGRISPRAQLVHRSNGSPTFGYHPPGDNLSSGLIEPAVSAHL